MITNTLVSELIDSTIKTGCSRAVQVEVLLGNPLQNCSGVGICEINLAAEWQRPPNCRCRYFSAQLKLLYGKWLLLQYQPDNICTQLKLKHLRNNHLQMQEPYTLNEAICQKLQLRSGQILAGKYPVFINPYYMCIPLDLKKL